MISLPITEPVTKDKINIAIFENDLNEFVPNKGDLSFYATHPEPDGTTLSLIEYSFAYSAFWQAEAALIYTADEIAAFEAAIAPELDAYRETFSAGDGIYGREMSLSVEWQRALYYREWCAKKIKY